MAHVTRRGKASLFRRNTETGHYLAQMAEGSRSTNLMCPPLRGTLALSRRRPSEAKQPQVAPELPCEPVAERMVRTKSSFSRHGTLPGLVDVSAHAWKLARQLNLDHHEVKFALDTLQSAAWSEKNGGMDLPTFRKCLLKIFDRQDISDGVLHAAYEDCGVGEGPIEPRRFVSWYRDHLFSLGCEGGSRLTLDLAKKHHCSCMDLDRVKMKFDQFDTDKSGVIEYPEFERMIFSLLHCSKNDLPECRMQRFWHELDQDGNGVVDFQEFTEWYLKYFALAAWLNRQRQDYGDWDPSWDPAWSSAQPSDAWNIWRGAWKKGREQTPQQPQRLFPHYDQAIPHGKDGKGRSKGKDKTKAAVPMGPSDTLVPEIQELLNVTRKAEQRVRQLQQAKEKKIQSWDRYMQEMQKSWMEEKQRYTKNIEKIEDDLEKALVAQATARQQLVESVPKAGVKEAATDRSANDEWDAMMNQWEKEQSEEDPSAVYRRAVAAEAQHSSAHQPRPLHAGSPLGDYTQYHLDQRAPPPWMQWMPWGFPPPPPGFLQPSAEMGHSANMQASQHLGAPTTRTSDVGPQETTGEPRRCEGPAYAGTSEAPVNAHPGAFQAASPTPVQLQARDAKDRVDSKVSPVHPGQRDLQAPRQPTSEAPPRPGIKEATRSTPVHQHKTGPTLTSKLEAAREHALQEAAKNAMIPEFADAPAHTPIPVLDDDPDEQLPLPCHDLTSFRGHFRLLVHPLKLRRVIRAKLFKNWAPRSKILLGCRLPVVPKLCTATGTPILPDDLDEYHSLPQPVRRPDQGPEVAAVAEGHRPASQIALATFVVLTIDGCPEVITTAFRTPATVAEALQCVSDARTHAQDIIYNQLLEVRPQPFCHFATVIALPLWCRQESVVCLDLTDIDGRIFAKSVPRQVDKATLCELAGLQLQDHFNIYAFGHPQPLGPQEILEVEEAGCIFFTYTWQPGRIGHMLPVMLRSPAGWEISPRIPSPAPARRFCFVLEEGQRLLKWPKTRGKTHQEVLAQEYHLDPANVTVQASRPPLEDTALNGWPCVTVAAVTVEISTIPVPPGRPVPPMCAFIIDARPLLRGFLLKHALRNRASHSTLVQELSTFLPEGHQVQLDGAFMDGEDFIINPGTVIVAQYVPLTSDEEADGDTEGSSSATSDEDSTEDHDGHTTSPPSARRTLDFEQDAEEEQPTASHPYSSTALAHPSVPLPHPIDSNEIPADKSKEPSRTQDILSAPYAFLALHQLHWTSCQQHLTSNLPGNMIEVDELVREVSGVFQQELPVAFLEDEHSSQVDNDGPQVPAELDTAVQPPSDYTTITFLILAPDYLPEQVEVRLALPQTTETALQAVAAARGPISAQRFPRLVTVDFQPFSEFAIALAMPRWTPSLMFVFFDCGDPPMPLTGALAVQDGLTDRSLLQLQTLTGQEDRQAPATQPQAAKQGIKQQPLEQAVHRSIQGLQVRLLLLLLGFICSLGNEQRENHNFQSYAQQRFLSAAHNDYCLRPVDLGLLDTLFEHFAQTAHRPVLELQSRIPISTYQQQVAELRTIVPTIVDISAQLQGFSLDWLDNDLGPLVRDPATPVQWKAAFANFRTTHMLAADEVPHRIIIYTDGSASQQTDAALGPAAWAFCAWLQTATGLSLIGYSAHSSVPPDTPYWLHESQDDSWTAEVLALAWALVWSVEFGAGYRVPIEFRYDATAPGCGTFAAMAHKVEDAQSHTPLAVFTNVLRQTLEVRTPVSHQHVKGHSGDLGNEICDLLAKRARKSPEDFYDRCLPLWPGKWIQHPLASWGWTIGYSGVDIPDLANFQIEAHRLQTTPVCPKPPSLGVIERKYREAEAVYEIHVASYNVLTLFDPCVPHGRAKRLDNVGLMTAGKRDLLKRQFKARGLWLIGLQETRLPESAVLPDSDYIMLNSQATTGGHGGCALWISKQHIYARDASHNHRVLANQLTVVSSSPRHLQVHIETPRLKLAVLVAHGPRAATNNDATVSSFWTERAQALCGRPHGMECVVLTDANSHVGSLATTFIGGHGAEEENFEGSCFHDFLTAVGCFLPATFDHFHSGPHHTWKGPGDNPVSHRLDFVAFPIEWFSFDIRTVVWEGFEALQARQDHVPTLALVRFSKLQAASSYQMSRRKPCRPKVDPTPQQSALFQNALCQASTAPWHLDVDTHYDQWVSTLLAAAQPLCEEKQPTTTQEYLTQPTLTLVHRRAAIRRYIWQENHEIQRRRLIVGFTALLLNRSGGAFTQRAQQSAETWWRQLDISLAHALAQLYETTTAIRAAVKRDRAAFLATLVEQISFQDMRSPKALYQAVRRAFPTAKSARRVAFQPLPAVRLEDGTLAQTVEQRQARWIEYFSQQEAGVHVTAQDYQLAFAAPEVEILPAGPVFSIEAVPTLHDIEQQLLRSKLRKACGPDQITSEILRLSVPHVSKLLLPVCLKTSLGVREPSEWRGGCLLCLAKRAQTALECKAFRSILMASVVGKAHHRILRSKLTPTFAVYKTSLQAGQMKGSGVEGIAHLARTFQLIAHHRREFCAITFYDVKSAFYQVIRQTLLPSRNGLDDTGFLRLLHGIGIPDSAIPELAQHLRNMATLSAAGTDDHLVSQVADLFRGSWFRLDNAGPLVLTRKGTRPGDPMADILFGFTFSAYLHSIELALTRASLNTPVPTFVEPSIWHDWPTIQDVGCLAWADDYAHMQTASTQPVLLQKVTQATSLLVTHASANGMQLSFAADKTAVLLCTLCSRALHPPVVSNEQGAPGLLVHDSITGTDSFLQIVDSYRHLGTIAVANATPGPEIAFRASQATATVKPLRRRLFSSPDVPLSTRRMLLRALVVSKFVFSSCAITLQAGVHRRTWCKHYIALWRNLCRWKQVEAQPHAFQVLLTASATSPLLAVALARATYLRRLLKWGPPELLHLLQAHWRLSPSSSWLGQFEFDIRAVGVTLPDELAVLRGGSSVERLLEAVQEDPHWWPRMIQRATKKYAEELQVWHQRRGASTFAPQPNAPPGDSRPFVCKDCGAAFKLRKHLGVHCARAHGQLSPARHYAVLPFCLACHKWFHDIGRVQYHLKQNHRCMTRLLHTIPPLTTAQVYEVEADNTRRLRKLRQGAWKSYTAAEPTLQVFFPRLPTYTESQPEDSDTLDTLRPRYRPSPSTVHWLMNWLQEASVEGPRSEIQEFWLQSPTTVSSSRQ
ncbi:unnamed protein product [Symbiodinium sp. CCMP2592]|nr:unnamed protein product [Symbiodinium sp. CCMP2592]